VAERARSLGGKAYGTLAEFSQHTRLKEQPGKQPPALTMVATDAGTNDFLTGLMEKHEKMAWMLRSINEK